MTEYIETGSSSDDALSGIETNEFPEEAVRAVFSGVLCVLTAALRLPRLKSEVRLIVSIGHDITSFHTVTASISSSIAVRKTSMYCAGNIAHVQSDGIPR